MKIVNDDEYERGLDRLEQLQQVHPLHATADVIAEVDALASALNAYAQGREQPPHPGLRWLNADEVTERGDYLWLPDTRTVPPGGRRWPVAAGHVVQVAPEAGVIVIPDLCHFDLRGARGRFFGPIPADDGG